MVSVKWWLLWVHAMGRGAPCGSVAASWGVGRGGQGLPGCGSSVDLGMSRCFDTSCPPFLSLTDDGKLSLEEFQLFFADGVLNERELEDLFHTIDSDNTK